MLSRYTCCGKGRWNVICDLCGKRGASVRHVSRNYGRGSNMLVVEGIPLVVCPNCGEGYLTAETLRQVERLRRQRGALAKSRRIAVIGYVKEGASLRV